MEWFKKRQCIWGDLEKVILKKKYDKICENYNIFNVFQRQFQERKPKIKKNVAVDGISLESDDNISDLDSRKHINYKKNHFFFFKFNQDQLLKMKQRKKQQQLDLIKKQ